MAVRVDGEQEIICAGCGVPAVRRQLPVHYPGFGTRFVLYETHAVSLTDDAHHAAIKRMDAFHEKLLAIVLELRSLPPEPRRLAVGLIADFDLESETPPACEVRRWVRGTALVRAFGT